MGDLPERMREAADTIERASVRLGTKKADESYSDIEWHAKNLRYMADRWELDDEAAEAKRIEVRAHIEGELTRSSAVYGADVLDHIFANYDLKPRPDWA